MLNLVNTPPVVSISKPTSGGVFYIYRNYRQGGWTGDTIDLVGTSSDANNLPAALTDQQVNWTRNGALLRTGHVASVNALDLGVGIHTITFHGTDGQLSATKSVTIEVKQWVPIVCEPGMICG